MEVPKDSISDFYQLTPVKGKSFGIDSGMEITTKMNVPARGEIKNENIDIHPCKKPKIEKDVKPKVEADIKIKTEPIEEFNRSIGIITNMNVPARPQVCNIGYDLFQLLKTEKTNSLSVKGFFWTRKYL